jgi:DNA mismatch repair protein MutL
MSLIRILPEGLINKIAAGEVVERPSSVVKELMENSIDAGADQIFVTIKNGGKDLISVLDNGKGMAADDAHLAIERHATSKISTTEDLDNINTMGFRGEALAAISAVSKFEMTTCQDEETGGFQIRVEGGKLTHTAKLGFPTGTRISVDNLFFNTPARQKFMKSANTEYNHIHNLIVRLALGRPDIQFRLTHNKAVILNIPKGQDFNQRVQHCFGTEILNDLVECNYEESYLSFTGLISDPAKNRSSKRWQHTFVNDRYVKCNTINHAIYSGYRTLLMKNMHPMFFIKVNLTPKEIDVNVHPTKVEIRLANPNLIHTIFSEQIARILKDKTRQKHLGINHSGIDNDRSGISSVSATGNNQTELKTTGNGSASIDPPNSGIVRIPERPSIFVKTDDQLAFESAKPPSPFSDIQPLTKPLAENEWRTDSNFKVIGQFHNKYILAEGEDQLVLIDQHAAHERIRFEEIRKQFYSRTLTTHALLIPIMMELPPQDGLLLEQNQESWAKLGFIIDHFGGNDYSIKEIPAILKDGDIPQVVREVLDEMAQFGKAGKLEDFFNEVFERMACHSAIRAAQSLSEREMQALLDQLTKLDLHVHCPHGRPVFTEISLDELDKRFKRI